MSGHSANEISAYTKNEHLFWSSSSDFPLKKKSVNATNLVNEEELLHLLAMAILLKLLFCDMFFFFTLCCPVYFLVLSSILLI